MTQTTVVHGEKVSLLRVLGPGHVWALGVGIVLVGAVVLDRYRLANAAKR